jgi:hypothetical protein|tara:strand:+ start:1291 stop:1506 length:216 start_codon:yes stop_codon:yes gene_type:complete
MNTSNKTLSRTFTCKTRKQARTLATALKQDGYNNIVTPTAKSASGWLVGAAINRPIAKKTFNVVNNKSVAA